LEDVSRLGEKTLESTDLESKDKEFIVLKVEERPEGKKENCPKWTHENRHQKQGKVNHLDGSSSSFKEVEGEEGNFLTVREETGDHQSFKYFLLKQNKYEVLERIPDFLE
jgi:hypothetical protein